MFTLTITFCSVILLYIIWAAFNQLYDYYHYKNSLYDYFFNKPRYDNFIYFMKYRTSPYDLVKNEEIILYIGTISYIIYKPVLNKICPLYYK